LRWSQWALFVCGILLLSYCGFVVVDSWLFQRRANQDLDRLLSDRRAASEVAPKLESPKVAPALADDELIGRIEIARLALSVAVVEGVDKVELRHAVGHIPGTALPGDAGNVGLAAHRDTFFSPLKDVKVQDEIQVSTVHGNFKYQVVSLKVVNPEDVGVLAPSGENVLTLVTCYPFYFVGPAPKRWIVRAKQVSPLAVASNMK
jgi:sortase A